MSITTQPSKEVHLKPKVKREAAEAVRVRIRPICAVSGSFLCSKFIHKPNGPNPIFKLHSSKSLFVSFIDLSLTFQTLSSNSVTPTQFLGRLAVASIQVRTRDQGRFR